MPITSPTAAAQADPATAGSWLDHVGHYVALAGLAGTALAVLKWLFTPVAIQIARKLLRQELSSLSTLSARLEAQTATLGTELERFAVLAEQLEKRIENLETRLNHSHPN